MTIPLSFIYFILGFATCFVFIIGLCFYVTYKDNKLKKEMLDKLLETTKDITKEQD